MSEQIKALKQEGYAVIETSQIVEGTAYKKLDGNILDLHEKGHSRIAVVTNADNPHLGDLQHRADRLAKVIPGLQVVVHAGTQVVAPCYSEQAEQ